MSVKLSINGKPVEVSEGSTILSAARENGIAIPTLCHWEQVNAISACRVCVVEVKGARTLQPACVTQVREGLEVVTDSDAVIAARRRNLELICSDHTMECTECPRGIDCELRNLCKEYEVNDAAFGAGLRRAMLDESMPHLVRNNAKCILCRRCEATCRVTQTVRAIYANNKGGETNIGFGLPLKETDCVACGQCVASCPTGALSVKDDTKKVWKAVYDKNTTVVAAVSPAAYTQLGRLFGEKEDAGSSGRIVSILHRTGIDLVIDSSAFANEFGKTVREIITEKMGKTDGPLIQCTCFAARQFVEKFYPQYIENILPLFNRRNALAQRCKEDLGEKKVFFVSIDACTSAKAELARFGGACPVDAALTTRELFTLIRQACVSGFTAQQVWNRMPPEPFDTLPFLGGPKPAGEKPSFTEKELSLGGRTLKTAEVTGLGNARQILKRAEAYDLIRIDACPGGCVNGGGSPRK